MPLNFATGVHKEAAFKLLGSLKARAANDVKNYEELSLACKQVCEIHKYLLFSLLSHCNRVK
jgi:hypothetical protein